MDYRIPTVLQFKLCKKLNVPVPVHKSTYKMVENRTIRPRFIKALQKRPAKEALNCETPVEQNKCILDSGDIHNIKIELVNAEDLRLEIIEVVDDKQNSEPSSESSEQANEDSLSNSIPDMIIPPERIHQKSIMGLPPIGILQPERTYSQRVLRVPDSNSMLESERTGLLDPKMIVPTTQVNHTVNVQKLKELYASSTSFKLSASAVLSDHEKLHVALDTAKVGEWIPFNIGADIHSFKPRGKLLFAFRTVLRLIETFRYVDNCPFAAHLFELQKIGHETAFRWHKYISRVILGTKVFVFLC
jgi:hypothetical protein